MRGGTFDAQYASILEMARARARWCDKELPYLGMYITQLVAEQGLNQHRDCHNHEKYLNYTINFWRREGGHFETVGGDE